MKLEQQARSELGEVLTVITDVSQQAEVERLNDVNPLGYLMRHQAVEVIKGLKRIVIMQGSKNHGKG